MADEIKQVDSQGSSSGVSSGPGPISPQIKVPAPSQSSASVPSVSIGSNLPHNLPVGPMKQQAPSVPSIPRPAGPVPSQSVTPPKPPITSGALPTQTIPPVAVRPSSVPVQPPAKPSMPQPAVRSGQSSSAFNSSIRTMEDDIAAIKRGEAPMGLKIEKKEEKEIGVADIGVPKITPPPPLVSHVELGRLEKAKPMAGSPVPSPVIPKIPLPPTVGPSKPGIAIPSTGGLGRFGLGSKRTFVMIIGVVVVVVAVLGLLIFRQQEPVTFPSATPIVSRTATPSMIPIESLFSVVDSVGISLGANFTTQFSDSVKVDPLISSKEPGVYRVMSVDGTRRYGLTEFINGVTLALPSDLKSLLDENSFLVSLIYKSTNKTGFGLILKLKNPDSTGEAVSALQNWESSMGADLDNLFQIDLTKAISVGFLDNTYNGVAVRYKNFSDPDSTIDYVIMRAKNGESYLILVNSKEHAFALIDKLR